MSESLVRPRTDAITGWLWPAESDRWIVAGPRARTFLVAFSLLFFELLCIRWIPSYIRYLGYFSNFILLASFLGIGLGLLSARHRRFWFPPFPVMLLGLVFVVAVNHFDFRISSTDVLYYGLGETQGAQVDNFLVLPLIFGLVAATFIPLARPLAGLFLQLKPLTAYSFDILGSLAGIAAAFVIAIFAWPPLVGFLLLGGLVLLLASRRSTLLAVLFLAGSAVIVFGLQQGAYWSPYYKILLEPAAPAGYLLNVNNTGHQTMVPWQAKEPFYRKVYELFPGPSFQHALILGAGSGSDTSTALAYGVGAITAVEIDPRIQELGAALHPDHPYQDPRVNVVINDGRAFLQNTTGRYDLIIFALPDSLTLTSGVSSLRLESFLLTQEALNTARDRLTGDGLLVLYNYYREDWLLQKLAGMAGRTFGQRPFVSTYGGWGRAAVIMAGPRLETLPPGQIGAYQEVAAAPGDTVLRVIGEGYYPETPQPPATDDWPFLYLRERSFPSIYVAGLLVAAAISLVGILTLAPRSALRRFNGQMFFLGMAFALLEVKALVSFALLFGSTWIVNSLVFFAILTSVLLGVLVNRRFRIANIRPFYGLLFALVLLNLLVPPEALLLNSPAFRYVLASLITFAPVFLANVIFSNAFRDSESADVAFASNLLGLMAGGALEYASMLIGNHLLLLLVLLFYACAMLMRGQSNPVQTTQMG